MKVKTLEEARRQEFVVSLLHGEVVETFARKWFHCLFNNNDHVFVNKLFEEDEYAVYEAYQDSGSVDYLYIIKKIS